MYHVTDETRKVRNSRADKPAAGNAGIAPRLTIERHRPGVPDPRRWPKRTLAQSPPSVYNSGMTVEELKSCARELPEDQRFELLVDLLGSLPVVLSDVDDGSEEAGRRLAEMRSDPSARMTWDEVKSEIGR